MLIKLQILQLVSFNFQLQSFSLSLLLRPIWFLKKPKLTSIGNPNQLNLLRKHSQKFYFCLYLNF